MPFEIPQRWLHNDGSTIYGQGVRDHRIDFTTQIMDTDDHRDDIDRSSGFGRRRTSVTFANRFDRKNPGPFNSQIVRPVIGWEWRNRPASLAMCSEYGWRDCRRRPVECSRIQ